MIRDVPTPLVEEFWPLVEPLLTRALQTHPHLNSDDLRALLQRGFGQLSVVLDKSRIVGATVMERHAYPSKMIGNVLACATEVGAWKAHGDEIENHVTRWCQDRDLRTLALLGRAGWGRFASRYGWRTQPLLNAWKDL